MTETIISIQDEKISEYLHGQNVIDNNSIFDCLINVSGKVYRIVKSRKTEEIKIDGSNYFIKKHYPISWKEFFKNIISFKNPLVNASHEYQAIIALKKLGINTLEVAAVASKNYNGFCYNITKLVLGEIGTTSFLITKSIEPNIELDKFCELLIHDTYYYKLKRALIKHIAETTRKIHLNGLNHRDYYLCHYLLNLDKNMVMQFKNDLRSCENVKLIKSHILDNIYLIDLHRMQIRSSTPERYIIKDLSSLLFSARNLKLTKADKLRFIKNYIKISDKRKFKTFMHNEKSFWRAVLYKAAGLAEKG